MSEHEKNHNKMIEKTRGRGNVKANMFDNFFWSVYVMRWGAGLNNKKVSFSTEKCLEISIE